LWQVASKGLFSWNGAAAKRQSLFAAATPIVLRSRKFMIWDKTSYELPAMEHSPDMPKLILPLRRP
ncbi:MAG: hypothetical protein WCL14_09755, partial [Bacteroidota bacterium]